MQLSTDRRSRRWTVDLALGRSWWMLPLAAIVPLAACSAWMRLGTFSSEYWFDALRYTVMTAGFACATAAVIIVAAVLNLRGARLRHRIASATTIALAALVLSVVAGIIPWMVILAGLSLTELTVMRLLGLPRWRIRPTTKRSRGASVTFLLAITAAAAVVTAGVTHFIEPGSMRSWHWYLLIPMGCLLGQVASSVAARRWAVVGGGVGGGAVVALVVLPLAGGVGDINSDLWNGAVSVASAYVAGWTIGYFHRCDHKRPVVEPRPATRAQNAGGVASADPLLE